MVNGPRLLGAHLSAAGGVHNVVKLAEQAQINSAQTMASAPMRWSATELPTENAEKFAVAQKGSVLKKLLFHGVYLINLARKDKQMFHLSKLSVATHMNFAYALQEAVNNQGGDLEVLGVTFHPGSAKDLTPKEGIERITYGINWILEHTNGGMLLLESSAGAGNIMGDTLEELAAMREKVEQIDRVGYVLDTQHMFVSGYDWRNNLDEIVNQIDSVLGLENVKSFHLNDSKTPFDSHKDRHASLGEGELGLETIKNIINHPKLKNIPFILETPALKDIAGTIEECDKLKSLVK